MLTLAPSPISHHKPIVRFRLTTAIDRVKTVDAQTASVNLIAAAKEVLVNEDEDGRKQMLETVKQAMAMLESPSETVTRTIMSPLAPAALMSLIKAGVIEEIAKSRRAVSARQLSEATGTDRLLIVRLLRPLCAENYVKEVGEEKYASTPVTKALLNQGLLGGLDYVFPDVAKSLINMPSYFERTGFRSVHGRKGPFQDAHKTEDSIWQWMENKPAMLAGYTDLMAAQQADRRHWMHSFDFEKILLQGASTDADATLLVDVAGGDGHDIAEIACRYPNAPGRLIVQDLPPVIDRLQELSEKVLPRKVERQKYDFFTPQPIQGARCYHFRSVLHDWSDSDCIAILKNTAMAMKPGYSRLLLSEFVLPAKNVPLYPALLDISMMATVSGIERTEAQFTRLLDKAGFRICKVRGVGAETEGLIEAVLKY